MQRRRFLSSLLPTAGAPLLASCAAGGPRPSSPPCDADAAERALRAIVDDPALPLASLSVATWQGGRPGLALALGRRWIAPAPAQAHRPATPDTLYRIASVSKLVTAIGALRLAEAGVLDLDADISAALGTPVRHPLAPQVPITSRLLLSHRSGLSDAAGYSFIDTDIALADLFRPGTRLWAGGAAYGAQGRPGEWFRYANLNYSLLGTLMEQATGEPFAALMDRLVLQPLGLEGGYDISAFSAATWGRTATLYRRRDDQERWQPDGPWRAQRDEPGHGVPVPLVLPSRYRPGRNATPYSPTGGLRISAPGLARIGALLLGEGQLDGVRLLLPPSVRLMREPAWRWNASLANGEPLGGLARAWGLGAQVFTDHGGPDRGDRLVAGSGWRGFGHFGNAYGAYTGLVVDPAQQRVVVYLVGGVGQDPETQPGRHSALYRFEERILAVLSGCG
ncbi:MAG: serine hydrolase domain-containing protein [Aquabacterium sp.]